MKMDAAALQRFLERDFEQVADVLRVDSVGDGVTLRFTPDTRHLRPGGTVSGPSMFMLADVAIYFAILNRIGEVPLTVTTGAHIDFMRKPAAGVDLLAQAKVLKLGRTLAVGTAALCSAGHDDVVAHAQMTYAIPPKS
ncbi:PaaI family thioesterase [Celeribacter arenosi]|uniref:PaaI family thioesterase n=1 Tax=Celeribacter arenosi TaxID=792649 RepID=A0ABP7KGZ0_9RHOB